MIIEQLLFFLLRWLVSSAGMWLCINRFGQITGEADGFWLYITAGLVFSLINSFVKPLAKAISLPLIILTMGIFTAIVNIAMVALTIWILPDVKMGFLGVAVTMVIMSVINGLVNLLVPAYNEE